MALQCTGKLPCVNCDSSTKRTEQPHNLMQEHWGVILRLLVLKVPERRLCTPLAKIGCTAATPCTQSVQ